MSILLFYVAVNILIAASLENNRKSIAVIFHAVLVTISLGVLFFWSNESAVSFALSNMLGDEAYRTLTKMLFLGDVSMMVPLVFVQAILLLQTIIVVVFAVQQFVNDLFSHKVRNYTLLSGKDFCEKIPFVAFRKKLYYLLSVIRC